MSAVSIGPLLFSTDRFAAIIGIGVFLVVMSVLGRLFKNDVARLSFSALLAGLLAARLGHVIVHWDTFGQELLRGFFIWQGGFNLPAGLVGLLLYGLLRIRRWPGAIAMSGATLAGLGVWSMTLLLTSYSTAVALPDQPLQHQVSGEVLALAGFSGKPMVINLWATWCPPCVRELPMMSQMAAQTPEVTFAFVNQGDPAVAISEFLARQGISLDVSLVDVSWQTSTHYGAKGLPTTLFIDALGRVVDTVVGEVSRESLQNHLDLIDPVGE